jgi:hypothetical protein
MGHLIGYLLLAAVALAALPSSAAAAAPECTLPELKKKRDTTNPSVSRDLSCTDADGDTLTYTLDDPVGWDANGTFDIAGTTVTFTPDDSEFAGRDFQEIVVSDGENSTYVYPEVFIFRSETTTTATGPTTVTAGTNATYTVTGANSAQSQDAELLDGFVQTSASSIDGVSYVGSSAACAPGGVASLYVQCDEFGTAPVGGTAQYTITFSFGPAAVGKTFEFTFQTRSPSATSTFQDLTIHVVAPTGSGGGDGGAGGGGTGGGGTGGTGGGSTTTPDTTPPAVGSIKGASTLAAATLIKSGYASTLTGLTPGDKVAERLELSRSVARGIGVAAAKPVVIGRGAAVANAQGVAKVNVKLTRKAKAALRKAKKRSVKATLVITVTDAAGNATVRRKPVSIKLKR